MTQTYRQAASTFELRQAPDHNTEQQIKHLMSIVHQQGRLTITGDLVRNGHLQESVTLLDNNGFQENNLKKLLSQARKKDIIAVG